MRGAWNFYHYGVLAVRRNDKNSIATKQMKNFFNAIIIVGLVLP